MVRSKGRCDKCGKKVNIHGIKTYKGRRLCPNCYNQEATILGCGESKVAISEEEALNRNYKVKRSGDHMYISPSIPVCLEGKKLKLKVVEDEKRTS